MLFMASFVSRRHVFDIPRMRSHCLCFPTNKQERLQNAVLYTVWFLYKMTRLLNIKGPLCMIEGGVY